MLVLALAASLSGVNALTATFQWGQRLPTRGTGSSGAGAGPCHATYHYLRKAQDAHEVKKVIGARGAHAWAGNYLALDSKRPRGWALGNHDGREGVDLVSAFESRL